MAKQTFTASGIGETVTGATLLYFCDFTSGTGSAQLEVNIDGTWYPAETARTATMAGPLATNLQHPNDRPFRWNVTVSSGSIDTVLSNR